MSTANDILENYQHIVESLSLTPGSKGTFDVTVDDELIFSKHDQGRHAEPGEVLSVFTERFAEGVKRYGDS